MRWNRDFTFEPWLLESWDVSDEASTHLHNIRPGVQWSNGDTLDADEVIRARGAARGSQTRDRRLRR
ncbi:ABC transporter substrate-binding protein [Rhodosalinus halophilus]|uniref:ABC transporter substrate-binding protein n=1 Tax=Rhodosalinus halophilus TaxID=2259333 RepID=UPI0018F67966|nr:ABC transporter substrate-binding protein [Rhodosalinus halophilus]